jgi:DnaJ-class molecular chaperone
MPRVILGLAFLIGIGLFLRHQYQAVVAQITSKQSRPVFSNSRQQESRIKCVMCNGTGRSSLMIPFGRGNSSRAQTCPSCHGLGWIDNPTFGR